MPCLLQSAEIGWSLFLSRSRIIAEYLLRRVWAVFFMRYAFRCDKISLMKSLRAIHRSPLAYRANFKPDQATIENILYEGQRGFTKKDILRFTSTEWVENRRNIIITGPTGCGKSYLAEAIGYKACTMGYPTQKLRYAILFEEIHSAKGTGQYLKYLSKLAKVKVLVIDDFLMGSIDCRDAETLMDIIEEKDQTGSVVVTTQFPVQKWHSRLPDPTIADAICDRLVHNAIQFNLKGESLRKKDKIITQNDR
jgi:DNA replication protein DnaC